MKKLFVALAFLVGTFTMVNAQNNIAIGPIVGVGLSKFTGDDAGEGVKFKVGPEFGASFIFSPQANWGIGADFLYSIEGAQAEVGNDKFKTNVDYIRVPLRFIYFFGDWDQSVRPKIFAGPTLGFLVKAESEDVDIKDGINGFDLGAHVGVGANFKIADQTWLNTDITYTHGFTNVAKEVLNIQPKYTNQRIALHVGVLFGIGQATM